MIVGRVGAKGPPVQRMRICASAANHQTAGVVIDNVPLFSNPTVQEASNQLQTND